LGINGFGRIGRLVLRSALGRGAATIIGINDPSMTPEYALHMLKYDSVHGRFNGTIKKTENGLIING
jgi:glyceraldehyde 3-phosphate dehydrogenase